MTLPILYSLRHCPYAMRARLAIFKSRIAVELRDVKLNNKPAAMLAASTKATVPILVVSPTHVIDESLDIMFWCFGQNDPENLLLDATNVSSLLEYITKYDKGFKPCIERYKAAKRYHEDNLVECREACEVFVQDLEQRLAKHRYVMGDKESVADLAIFPFIRQFAKVERSWYVNSSYNNLDRWLRHYLQSAMFNKVMALQPIWEQGSNPLIFGGDYRSSS